MTMTRTTTGTIIGGVAFLFATAASVPLDMMRGFGTKDGGEAGAVLNPDGSLEVSPPKMMLEVANDEFQNATMIANSTSEAKAAWGGRRRRHKQTKKACKGKELRIYGTDKTLKWILQCQYNAARDTVRFVGGRDFDNGAGTYYVELVDGSQARALLKGSATNDLALRQGDPEDGHNAWEQIPPQGMLMAPTGHFKKNNGDNYHESEAVWVLLDSQGQVAAPGWMENAVGATAPSQCNGPAVGGDCDCAQYWCVLMVQCIEERVKDAPNGDAKNACTKIMNGQAATDDEKQCCMTLLHPCTQPSGDQLCAFKAVMSYHGHALFEQEDGTVPLANESRPSDDAASLDEAMTGKRSC